MPSIQCDKVVLDDLNREISESVVTIKRYNQTGFVDFGTGFIIHATRSEVLVCTDQTLLKQGERTYVYYSDGTCREASEFIKRTPCGHAVLLVPVQSGERRRHKVTFSETPAKREEVCTIAQVKRDGELGFMSGIVVAPSAKTMLVSGKIITRLEKKFAVTCPHGRQGHVEAEGNLIGAAVFSLSGLVVGTIESAVSLSRGGTPLSRGSEVVHVGSKSKRSHEDQAIVAAEKRTKYAAKRQKLENWCGGSPW